jgi:hypothetical protein
MTAERDAGLAQENASTAKDSVPPPSPVIHPSAAQPTSSLHIRVSVGHWELQPLVSGKALAGAMLLSFALGWLVYGVLIFSFTVMMLKDGYGMPITVAVGIAAGLKIEQQSVYMVSAWRPPLWALAALAPVGVLAAAACDTTLSGGWLQRWLIASLAGWAVNGVVLHRFVLHASAWSAARHGLPEPPAAGF